MKSDAPRYVLWAVSALTLGWLAVMGFAVWLSMPCDDKAASFLSRHVQCRAPNELGDFLAGAFAPVAFLWLAAAVFIQSKELRAQIDEMVLTRDVLNEQASAAAASSRFVDEQTRILKIQGDRQATSHNQEIFQDIIDSLYLLVKTKIYGRTKIKTLNPDFEVNKSNQRLRIISKEYLINALVPRLAKENPLLDDRDAWLVWALTHITTITNLARQSKPEFSRLSAGSKAQLEDLSLILAESCRFIDVMQNGKFVDASYKFNDSLAAVDWLIANVQDIADNEEF